MMANATQLPDITAKTTTMQTFCMCICTKMTQPQFNKRQYQTDRTTDSKLHTFYYHEVIDVIFCDDFFLLRRVNSRYTKNR